MHHATAWPGTHRSLPPIRARAARNLKRHFHDPLWVWQLALIGSLVAWYVHGLVDYFYEFMPTNTAFWLLVGLAISLYRMESASFGTKKPLSPALPPQAVEGREPGL